MKTLVRFLSIATAIALYSCTSSYQSTGVQDDVYSFGTKKTQIATQSTEVQPNTNTSQNVQEPYNQASETVIKSNPADYSTQQAEYSQPVYQDQIVELEGEPYYETSFASDDYYDYSYASRIKRFHEPLEGVGYYDSYYTNRYWHDYNPMSWGTTIYIGYDYAYPYYNYSYYYPFYSGFYWGSPWYSPYFSYNYWGYPYYWGGYWGGYYGGGYWAGYNNGYWDGFYDGSYWGHYNPCDVNSYYYGNRSHSYNSYGSNRSSNNRSAISGNNYKADQESGRNMGSRTQGRSERDFNSDRNGYFSGATQTANSRNQNTVNAQGRADRTGQVNQDRTSTRREADGSNSQRMGTSRTGTTDANRSNYSYRKYQDTERGKAEKYTRPQAEGRSTNTTSTSGTRKDSDRAQGRSTYERPSTNRESSGQNTRTYSPPTNSRNNQSTGTNYSTPTRTTNRSGSGTSTRSYSSPSRSSYSSPSNYGGGSTRSSGGGSSGGSSRSGSSGGGRR